MISILQAGKLVRVTCWAHVGLCEDIYGDLLLGEYQRSFMMNEKHFENQKLNLNLFYDKELYGSNTRINSKKLRFLQKQLILVRSNFTKVLILKMS